MQAFAVSTVGTRHVLAAPPTRSPVIYCSSQWSQNSFNVGRFLGSFLSIASTQLHLPAVTDASVRPISFSSTEARPYSSATVSCQLRLPCDRRLLVLFLPTRRRVRHILNHGMSLWDLKMERIREKLNSEHSICRYSMRFAHSSNADWNFSVPLNGDHSTAVSLASAQR
jgi:hypothetical protein